MVSLLFPRAREDRSKCTFETCPLSVSYFSYRVSLAANATLLALFSFSLVCFLVQVGLSRRFVGFTIAMVSGCVLEVLGYIGRIMEHHNPWAEVVSLIPDIRHNAVHSAYYVMSLARISDANCVPYNCARISRRRYIPLPFPHCDDLWRAKLSYRPSHVPTLLHSL